MFSRAFSRISFLLAIFAAVLMTACGGGSGTPPGSERIVLQLSESKIAYGPIRMEIFNGRPPFYIRTNSSAVVFPEISYSRTVYGFVLPCSEDGVGMVTVWDDLRETPDYGTTATFEAPAASFEPSTLTVTATNNTGCTAGTGGNYAQICAGSPGIAELQLNGYGGAIGGASVRFDVVQGNYQIRADGSSAWGASVVMATDSAGKAQVAIQTTPGVATHTATISARASGLPSPNASQTLNTLFTIVGADFQMLPTSASWTSATTTCPSRTASFSLYGGTPPYMVQTTLGSLSAPSVAASGGTVTLTVAVCGTGELTARDALGSTITAAISYTASTSTEPEPPPPVVASPLTPPSWGTSTATGRVPCNAGSIFGFTVAGGTPPYSVTALPMAGVATASLMGATLGQVTFSGAPAANSNFVLYVVDSTGKAATTTPTIYCQ
jgi:hypothetical protein